MSKLKFQDITAIYKVSDLDPKSFRMCRGDLENLSEPTGDGTSEAARAQDGAMYVAAFERRVAYFPSTFSERWTTSNH